MKSDKLWMNGKLNQIVHFVDIYKMVCVFMIQNVIMCFINHGAEKKTVS